jgi:hypothetical protein
MSTGDAASIPPCTGFVGRTISRPPPSLQRRRQHSSPDRNHADEQDNRYQCGCFFDDGPNHVALLANRQGILFMFCSKSIPFATATCSLSLSSGQQQPTSSDIPVSKPKATRIAPPQFMRQANRPPAPPPAPAQSPRHASAPARQSASRSTQSGRRSGYADLTKSRIRPRSPRPQP